MPFTGKIGDTLRLSDIGARHRYIIITNPNSAGNVVIVNVTTAKHFDWLVTFKPKDNQKLFSAKCTPNYTDARLYPIKSLSKIVKRHPREYVFCPENITKKIVIGAFQSRHTPLEIIEELGIQYPNEYKGYYSDSTYPT